MHRAKYIKDAILSTPQFKRPENATEEEWVVSIMENVSYSPDIMKQTMANKIRIEGGKAYGCYFPHFHLTCSSAYQGGKNFQRVRGR